MGTRLHFVTKRTGNSGPFKPVVSFGKTEYPDRQIRWSVSGNVQNPRSRVDRPTMANKPLVDPLAKVTTLGGVLRSEREHRLLGVNQIARLAGVQVDTIRALEGDDHGLTPQQLDEVITHYQAPDWMTQRGLGELTLDLNEGIVSFSNTVATRALDNPADRVLARYVLLLYRHLGVEIGTKIPVKAIDLMVLRAALSVHKPEVEAQIQSLKMQRKAREEALEGHARLGVGALLLVAVALGLAIMFAGSDAEPAQGIQPETVISIDSVAPPIQEATIEEATVEIGEAVSIVRPPSDVVQEAGN